MAEVDSASPSKSVRRDRLVAVGMVAGFIAATLLVVVATRAYEAWHWPRTAHDGLSDAQVEAILMRNISRLGGDASGVHRRGDGLPDLHVWAGILTVSADGDRMGDYDALCRTIAGVTVNPATGRTLGISLVTIRGSGDDGKIVQCTPLSAEPGPQHRVHFA